MNQEAKCISATKDIFLTYRISADLQEKLETATHFSFVYLQHPKSQFPPACPRMFTRLLCGGPLSGAPVRLPQHVVGRGRRRGSNKDYSLNTIHQTCPEYNRRILTTIHPTQKLPIRQEHYN